MSKFDPHKFSFTLSHQKNSPPTKNDISKKILYLKKHIFETPHTKKWHFRDDHIPKMDFSILSHAKNGIFETSTIHKNGVFKIPAYKHGNFATPIQKNRFTSPPHFQ